MSDAPLPPDVQRLDDETSSRLGPIQASLDRVLAACRRRLGTWELAQEAAGETFIHVLRCVSQKSGLSDADLIRWIEAVGEAASRDALRRRGAKSDEGVFDSSSVERRAAGSAPADRPDRRGAGAAREGTANMGGVEALREPHRSVLKMRAWCGMEFADIARSLGHPPDSVRQAFAAALKTLGDEELAARMRDAEKAQALAALSPAELCALSPALRIADEPVPGRLRVAVLERAVAMATNPAGILEFVNGPLDVFPADVAVGGRIRMGGESGVERIAGTAIYVGEFLMTGPKTSVALSLASGRRVVLGPSSAVMVGLRDGAGSADVLTLLAGRLVSVDVFHPARPVAQTAVFLGRQLAVQRGDFGVMLKGQAAGIVELFDADAAMVAGQSRKAHKGRVFIDFQVGRQADNVKKLESAETARWLATISETSGFPGELRAEVPRLMRGEARIVSVVEDGPVPAAAATPAPKAPAHPPVVDANSELQKFLEAKGDESGRPTRASGAKKPPVAIIAAVAAVLLVGGAVAAYLLTR